MGTLRWIAVSASLLVLNACSTSAQTPDAKRHALRFELTGVSVTFDASRYANFDDYIAQTKAHLESYKVYFDPNNLDEELILATPFRVEPSTGQRCLRREGVSRGIVLIHGLSDMPAAMKDLANSFAKKCFLSYTLLLPAHGARASEMLDVTRHDWVAAAQFAVKSLRSEVDEVYVGGFSLGGLVALQAAIKDKNIAGVFGFSPALALHRSIFLDQTIWLRYVRDWLDTDAPDDPWRFESIPFNAIAETQLLSKSVRDQLKNTPLTVPVFLAQSPDDAIVDADTNQQFFESGMTHSKSRLVSYSSDELVESADSRILMYPSVLPEQRILSYAHQAVHISPENKHYGARGSYRNCNNDINSSATAVNHCLRADMPFRGEVFGSAVRRYDDYRFDSMARLTFNPQFSQLMDEIGKFIGSLKNTQSSSNIAAPL